MPKSNSDRYRNPAIKQLADQQVRFAPVAVRLEQIARAEDFLFNLNPSGSFPYPKLCELITRYRPESYPDLRINGADLLHDLRCFVEDLSRSANLSADDSAEPVLTLDEVSEQLNVSTKTVTRWRDQGLPSRWYIFGSRRRIGFLESSVRRFVAAHSEFVQRSSRFSQLSEHETEFIIRRARRLALYGASLNQILKRLSRRTGRSRETIRYTIREFDRRHPGIAVFPESRRKLTDDDRYEIHLQLRRGVSPSVLAERYGRTASSIHRIATEYRVRLLVEQPIEFIDSDEFPEWELAPGMLAEMPELELPEVPRGSLSDQLPPYLTSLYTSPLLTADQERQLFRKMNYLKYLAARRRESIATSTEKVEVITEVDRLLMESQELKNILIRCNLRLVVSVARRHRRGTANLFDMISDGNMTLIRAIEKFDYRRGNRFSTYATWALMRSYARSVPTEDIHRSRFQTGADEQLTASADRRAEPVSAGPASNDQMQIIEAIVSHLTEREQEAITLRFALRGQAEPLTLDQVGERLGVSGERARQIISRGLERLREIAAEHQIDLDAL